MRGARGVIAGAIVVCMALAHIRGASAIAEQPRGGASGPAYSLIELPSGRILAESRPEILSTPVAPGSLLKLATIVAAVESGLVDEQTRIMCPRTVEVDGKPVACSHPDLHRPLSATEALGYSCNAFFATVARRLPRPSLDAALVRLGLPPLAAGTSVATGAVGLGGVKASPRQLLEAFLRAVGASRHAIAMPDSARRILRAGTELAARAGTASALGAAGLGGLAKTGTAPMPGGGYMGLVAALAATDLPTHAIIVVAPGAAGADAATVAAQLLARHAAPRESPRVRLGIARRDGGYDVELMEVEDYVARVVAGEMGAGASPAALEAMAITARTFLEANRGRHGAEGFDVCDLTHCQVLRKPDAAAGDAARATAGLILTYRGRPAHVFYSSWCGGHTELPSRVWPGADDPPYLPAQPDGACANDPPWTTNLAERDLRRVLDAMGLRGNGVSQFTVIARHPSGRAASLGAAGMVPDRVDAGSFQLAAGRLLGWQTVKSTLFDVARTANGYALTGRGSGHGVGLCVRGALNRARQGASCDRILSTYFPGLVVTPASTGRGGDSLGPAFVSTLRVVLPEAERDRLRATEKLAARALRQVAERLGLPEPLAVELVFHPTIEAYTRQTGQPWWTAGRTRGSRIDLLPRQVLATRGILESTLRHEFTHLVAGRVLEGRALWVREGLAVVIAGELAPASSGPLPPEAAGGVVCPSDDAMRTPASAAASRRAYQDAGRCVAQALAAGRRWQDLR